MKTIWIFGFVLSVALSLGGRSGVAEAQNPLPVVIVDKSKFQLHIANYNNGLEIFKTYSLTLGKNSGDKMLEGDQKTPEGIYRFTARYTPPTIKKKFGAMAFYVDYPNSLDRREKKTGFDIMLHSTDDPKRLEQPQDSDGCLVVDDARIREISQYISPPYTTLLIYDVMKPEYLKLQSSDELKAAFSAWLAAWSSKNIDAYIGAYASDFRFEQMNRDQYRAYKDSLNKKYETIQVEAREPRFFRHPKYDMVAFTQEYSSTFKGGRKAFVARGQKRIYFVRENGQLKIFSEEFSRR